MNPSEQRPARPWQIYTLTDPRTGAVRYVGMTFRGHRRLNEHLSRALKRPRNHRETWMRGLLLAGLTPIHRVVEEGVGSKWRERERHWISDLRKTCDLVNRTDGGEGLPGFVPSAELRAKWSEQRKGVKYAPGRRSWMLGRSHTIETRERISKAGQGRLVSTEARQKISSRNSRPVQCIETGEVFTSFGAAGAAFGVTGNAISKAIRRGRKCVGMTFRRLATDVLRAVAVVAQGRTP